jgi:alcohol dehydrogenase
VSAFADYAVVSEKSIISIDDDVPAGVAAVLGCAVLTGAGAVFNVAQPLSGDTVAVVGLGGVGMAAVLAASYHPGVEVVAIDLSPERREQALTLGAKIVMSPGEAEESGVKANFVIEASGNSKAFATAIGRTAPGGTTVTVGLPNPEDNATISVLDLVAEGRSIVGCYMGSSMPKRDIPKFLKYWREGKFPIDRLITSRVSLDRVNEAMDDLAAAKGIRQIIGSPLRSEWS